MNRAYSVIDFRAVDDEKRIIEGIASTPQIDSYQSVLEPEGAVYKLPIPVLYQHNSKQPIGQVIEAKRNKDGIRVKLQLAKEGVAGFIDEAWSLIRAGLVRGLSVGFDPIEETFDKSFQGIRYTKWRWLELSTVTIAANSEASILSVRSADEAILAALGTKTRSVVHLAPTNSPGVSGQTKGKAMPKKTIAEQQVDFANLRASKQARVDELVDAAAEGTRTLTPEEKDERAGLVNEIKEIDEHLAILKEHESQIVARAAAVTASTSTATVDPEKRGQEIRRGVIEVGKPNRPKGIGVARMAMAMIRAGRGNGYQAMEIAKKSWPDQPEVYEHIRAVVEAGDTTTSGWASQLVPAAQQMDGEFLEMLRDAIVIGRIPGLKKVPFNVSVPLQSGGGTYGYVGEGAPKPVTSPTYGNATLRFEKAAGIIVITQELARFSSPDAEQLVRDEMIKGLTAYFDTIFVSAGAAVSNVMPAGILNGISATPATGTTAAFFRKNMDTIIGNMITNKRDPSKLVILMSASVAMRLGAMMNSLGSNPEFPTIGAKGGNYLDIPIVISQALGTNIVLIDPGDILLAEDPAVSIDVSTEASVEMDSTPAAGETSPITTVSTLKSFWQNNLVGIRCEQFRTWKVGRTSAVEYISGANYQLTT